jgi:lipopolysaccharide exporter
MVVVAAVFFRTLEACAIAYLLAAVGALPIFWWSKRRCVPDDAAVALRYLRSTALVTLATVAIPALHVAQAGVGRTEVLPLVQWLGASGAGVVCGLVALGFSGHPLANEAPYRRLMALVLRRRSAP